MLTQIIIWYVRRFNIGNTPVKARTNVQQHCQSIYTFLPVWERMWFEKLVDCKGYLENNWLYRRASYRCKDQILLMPWNDRKKSLDGMENQCAKHSLLRLGYKFQSGEKKKIVKQKLAVIYRDNYVSVVFITV